MSASQDVLNDLLGLVAALEGNKLKGPKTAFLSKRCFRALTEEDRLIFEILHPDVKIVQVDP